MATRTTLRPRTSVKHLRQTLARSDDEAQKTRIRAIISIKEGDTHTEVAQRFCTGRDTIARWVQVYNEGGTSALKMNKGGRPKGNHTWEQSLFTSLVKEVDKGGYWSVPRMQEWLREHKQQEVPESTVWYHVTRLGYSHKSARPHPYKGDTKKQEVFKKGA